MKISVIGTGAVGIALANGLTDLGHTVVMGSHAIKSVEGWDGEVLPFADTLNDAELIVLAVKGIGVESLVTKLAEQLYNKVVIDTCNPISSEPPIEGVVQFFTSQNQSLMERLQSAAPKARFVKAFNSVGASFMVNPDFGANKPTMFICGNHDASKIKVGDVIEQLGWEVEDMGSVVAARAIEPLCMLWCIPGFKNNDWGPRAFKLLKD